MLEDDFLNSKQKEPLNLMALFVLLISIVDTFQNELTRAFNFLSHLNF
jgi:hypothetical protein